MCIGKRASVRYVIMNTTSQKYADFISNLLRNLEKSDFLDQTMPYEVEYPWRRNPRLMKLICWDDVPEDEMNYALEDVAAMMDQATMPMHVVIEFHDGMHAPENLLDIFLDSRLIHHEQCGFCLFLNPSKFTRFLGQVLSQRSHAHIEFRPDDEGAWEFFSQMGFC